MKTKSKTFRGTLERIRGNGVSWVIVRLPFSVEKTWGSRGLRRVHVAVNGLEYRMALFPVRGGEHFILINNKVQKAAGLREGSVATFTMAPDLEPRVLTLPKELERTLNQDRTIRKWFDRLNFAIRKSLVDYVSDAKAADTRLNRADRVAEQLLETMEAELELPPMIRLAFNRNPGAEQVWRSMTETQRRHNLLSIFFRRTPQSRMQRIQRMIDQALEEAERKEEKDRSRA
jgi:uncharacterized protein YdeI (YjbR/CyaY-like superfamily)